MRHPALTTFALACSVAAFAGPPPPTTTSMAFNPSASVAQFAAASAVVTVTSGGSPVTSGTVKLYEPKFQGLPGTCTQQNGNAAVQPPLEGEIGANGQVTFTLPTGVARTFGYIAKFASPGHYDNSSSACLDFTVTAGPGDDLGCTTGTNATISTTIASSPGFPLPGSSNVWNLNISIRACKNLTGVSAQGGKNAWTGAALGSPNQGDVTLRKATGGKNEVWIWNVGSLTAGQTVTLPVTITGNIKPSTACGSVLGLMGSWSAISTSSEYGQLKSAYTGTTTATVGPDPCTI